MISRNNSILRQEEIIMNNIGQVNKPDNLYSKSIQCISLHQNRNNDSKTEIFMPVNTKVEEKYLYLYSQYTY